MKFLGKVGLAALAGLLLAGSVGHAQEMKFWRIGTGGAGGTYFPIGGLIANAISNPPGSRPCDKGGACGRQEPGRDCCFDKRVGCKHERNPGRSA